MTAKFSREQEAIDLYLSGLDLRAVGQRLGVAGSCVRSVLIRNNIPRRPSNTLPAEIRSEVVRRYRAGETVMEIEAAVGVSRSFIYRLVYQNNLDPRVPGTRCRRYKIDETVFDSENSDMAYWVGFLMADGHVRTGKIRNSNSVTVRLKPSDSGHLDKLVAFLKSDIPVKISRSKNNFSKDGFADACCISFFSERICQVLGSYGVVYKKSLNEKVIGLEHNRDFWRGVIDGDGYVDFSKTTHKPVIFLCGSREIIDQFLSFVRLHCPACRAQPIKSRTRKYYSTNLVGEFAFKMMSVIYANSHTYLDRKMSVVQAILDSDYVPRKAGRPSRSRN